MYLHRGYANRLDRIQDSDAGVCIGGGIENKTIHFAVSGLDLIHQVALMVGLIQFCFDTASGCVCLYNAAQIIIGLRSVDFRLPNAQHIDIGTIDHKYSHRNHSSQKALTAAAAVS